MSDSMEKELQKFELPTRTDFPWVTTTITVFGVVLSALHIWFNTLSTLPELWISATHFAGFAVICALWYPAHISLKQSKMALAVDVLIAAGAIACLLYIPYAEDALYERGVKFVTSDWVFAIMAILIVIELIRRTMGWFIPVLIVICLSYVVLWGKWATGIFHFPGLSIETLLYRSFYSSEGMFGSISRISWTFVFYVHPLWCIFSTLWRWGLHYQCRSCSRRKNHRRAGFHCRAWLGFNGLCVGF